MSGLMPANGVVAGSPLVAGGISEAPETEATACPVRYHKNGCRPVDDREAWNWFIANFVRALNDVDIQYDCTSVDQFRAVICAIAQKCVTTTVTGPEVICRSEVSGTFPPATQVARIIVDDSTLTTSGVDLYLWDCDATAYVHVTIGSPCPTIPDADILAHIIGGVGRTYVGSGECSEWFLSNIDGLGSYTLDIHRGGATVSVANVGDTQTIVRIVGGRAVCFACNGAQAPNVSAVIPIVGAGEVHLSVSARTVYSSRVR